MRQQLCSLQTTPPLSVEEQKKKAELSKLGNQQYVNSTCVCACVPCAYLKYAASAAASMAASMAASVVASAVAAVEHQGAASESPSHGNSPFKSLQYCASKGGTIAC